ncbi:hypothetical protein WJX73_004400, partial [Symbiochloris irregularis]
ARAGIPGSKEKAANSRYFGATPQSADQLEFQGLEPGKLSSELRTALGLGPLDPPPWIHRMRQLGYPPGYVSTPAEPDEQPVEDRIDFLDDAHAQPVAGSPLDGSADEAASPALPDPGDAAPLDDEPAVDDLDFIPFALDSDDMQLSDSAAQAEAP